MQSEDEELEPDVMQIEPSIASTTNINSRKRAAEKAPYSTPKKPREATSGTPNRILPPQTPSSITKKMGTLTFLTPVTAASVPNTPKKSVDIFAKPTASRLERIEEEVVVTDEDIEEDEITREDEEDLDDISEDVDVLQKIIVDQTEIPDITDIDQHSENTETLADIHSKLFMEVKEMDLPKIMKDRMNDLEQRLSLIGYGGSGVERISANVDWKSAKDKAEFEINLKCVEPHRDHVERNQKARDVICPIIAHNLQLQNCVRRVTRIQEEMDWKLSDDVVIESHLKFLTTKFNDQFIGQLTNIRYSAADQWAINLSRNTTDAIGFAFTNYACYGLAKYSSKQDFDIEEFFLKFCTKDFHDDELLHYREYAVLFKKRQRGFMAGSLNFLRGVNQDKKKKFQSNEYEKMKVGEITNVMVNLKLFGVYPKTRSGTPISSGKSIHSFSKAQKKERVSLAADVWPLSLYDFLKFLFLFQVRCIFDEQLVLLVFFMIESGWRTSSILSYSSKSNLPKYHGLRIRDLKFSFVQNGIPKFDCTGLNTKTGKPMVFSYCANGRKHCLFMLLIDWMNKRKIFREPIVNVYNTNIDLNEMINPDMLDEFLFCKTESGRILNPKASLQRQLLKNFFHIIADKLHVPRFMLTPKSTRKAKAVEQFMECLKTYKGLTTIRQVVLVLNSMQLWDSDACIAYLTYGDDNIHTTLNTYRSLIKSNPNVNPEDCHVFISDVSLSNDEYFTPESPLVVLIFDAYAAYWKKTVTDTYLEQRKISIAAILNQFMIQFKGIVTRHTPIDELNPTTLQIDLEVNSQFYSNDFTVNVDPSHSNKCLECKEILPKWDLKKHVMDHGLVKFACEVCPSVTDTYHKWKLHMNHNHIYRAICRGCNAYLSYNFINECIKDGHNVVHISTTNLHFKDREHTHDEPIENHALPSTINVIFKTSEPNLENIWTKEEILKNIADIKENNKASISYALLLAYRFGCIRLETFDDPEFLKYKEYLVAEDKNLI
uniref:C2H2-type domain-containing protein n=1 Tax=Panagrolaimus sp. ES5 TaxID=591445 RepID=A0AC34FWF1_9BILA